jgi:hypothetical protein
LGTTSRLRSTDNLHKVYGELTELEYVLVRLKAHEYAGTIHTTAGAGHEECGSPSVLVHDLSLARHIDHSSDSEVANDAGTSHLASSSEQTGQHYSTMITSARSMNVIVSLGRDAWSTFSSRK